MKYDINKKKFQFRKPAIYEIVVDGKLDISWSDRLGGMQITVKEKPGTSPSSMLIGRIMDQSALAGILHTLYEHHMAIISVKMIKDYNID